MDKSLGLVFRSGVQDSDSGLGFWSGDPGAEAVWKKPGPGLGVHAGVSVFGFHSSCLVVLENVDVEANQHKPKMELTRVCLCISLVLFLPYLMHTVLLIIVTWLLLSSEPAVTHSQTDLLYVSRCFCLFVLLSETHRGQIK